VIVSPKAEIKGGVVNRPVEKERSAELWPRIANNVGTVVMIVANPADNEPPTPSGLLKRISMANLSAVVVIVCWFMQVYAF
jgi:hypothetical protein